MLKNGATKLEFIPPLANCIAIIQFYAANDMF